MDLLNYYLEQGVMTRVTTMKEMIGEIPADIKKIVTLVQNFLLHQHFAVRYGVELTPEQQQEPTIRGFNDKLVLLRGKGIEGISQPLPVDQKLIGICRDFSVISAALCREAGIPARARCGFATYFEKDRYVDHWVLEYWHREQQRWLMVDAQLDELQRKRLDINFDTLNVSKDHFLVAGKAWQLCRCGEKDPKLFGIFQWWGFDYLKCNLILDANSLLKVPMQPWDFWEGYKNTEIADFTEADYRIIDELARLTLHVDQDFSALESFVNGNSRIKVDSSYLNQTG